VRRGAAAATALLLATVLVYAPVRRHAFVNYDDPSFVARNPVVVAGLSREGLVAAFSEAPQANWIPLTWISYQVDQELHGLSPGGVLLGNVLLHALASVLLLAALLRMTGALAPSLFVAGVFALHPLHVESVAWASERKDVLSGFFWMLALYAYAGFVEARSGGAAHLVQARRVVAVTLAGLASLLAKPMAVTLPCVLLLLDLWPLGRLGGPGARRLVEAARLRAALLEKTPLLLVALGVGAVTYVAQRDQGAVTPGIALPFAARLANALAAQLGYLGDVFLPRALSPFHPFPLAGTPPWRPALGALVVVVLSAVALRLVRSRPWLLVGWLWWLGTLAPVAGLLQVGMQSRADRYTYVPLVGLALAVAFEARHRVAGRRGADRVVAAAGALALAALAALSSRQVAVWRDTESLYRQMAAVSPDNFLAEYGLGLLDLDAGRFDEARRRFAAALRLRADFGPAQVGMADAAARAGRGDEALLRYEDALRLVPGHARAWREAGRLLAEAGRHDEAAVHLERAVALAPEDADAQARLGLALLRGGRFAESARAFDAAFSQGAESPELHVARALAATRLGDAPAAVAHYRAALEAKPGWREAANNLAWLLATHPQVRDAAEAERVASAVLASAPDDLVLLDTLAAAHAAAGRFEEARRLAARAAERTAESGDAERAAAIRARLELYRAGRAYDEMPGPP
jgi:tetratricopeptide (TPR) repeat protein